MAEDGTPMATAPRSTGVDVGVVGVWKPSGRGRGDRMGRSCWETMEDDTALIREHTALRVLAFPQTDRDIHAIATRITALSARASAVFVTGLRSSESMALRAEVRTAEAMSTEKENDR